MTQKTQISPTRTDAGQSSRTLGRTLWFALVVAISSCVTVNVNFPEGAVQKATDDYVRDLYRAKQQDSGSAKDGAFLFPSITLGWVASAQAADTEIKQFSIDSPGAREIQKSQLSRISGIIKYKKMGVLGETADGQLEIKDASKAGGKLQATQVERLVKSENEDRAKLYQEILRSNGMPDTDLKNIEESFSRSFQGESPSGTWLQNGSGSWTQKR